MYNVGNYGMGGDTGKEIDFLKAYPSHSVKGSSLSTGKCHHSKAHEIGKHTFAGNFSIDPDGIKKEIKAILFNSSSDDAITPESRIQNLATTIFPDDKKKAEAFSESMFKYRNGIANCGLTALNPQPVAFGGEAETESAERINLTESLTSFIYDVTGQHVVVDESGIDSKLMPVIEEIKSLKNKFENRLCSVRFGLSTLPKIDLEAVERHRSYSTIAKERKARIVSFLKFLSLLFNPQTRISKFNAISSDIESLNDPNIINTFPEEIWENLRELRISLEKIHFVDQMKSLEVMLEELKKIKNKFLLVSNEISYDRKTLCQEHGIDKDTEIFLFEEENPVTAVKESAALKKNSQKKYSSNPIISIGQRIADVFRAAIRAIKHLWKVFWY